MMNWGTTTYLCEFVEGLGMGDVRTYQEIIQRFPDVIKMLTKCYDDFCWRPWSGLLNVAGKGGLKIVVNVVNNGFFVSFKFNGFSIIDWRGRNIDSTSEMEKKKHDLQHPENEYVFVMRDYQYPIFFYFFFIINIILFIFDSFLGGRGGLKHICIVITTQTTCSAYGSKKVTLYVYIF